VADNWFQENSWWLGPLAGLIGSGAEAYGSISSADKVADALREQGQLQDKLSRDVMATGIEYANEQRDIGLGLGEPWRIAGVTALAGMADMVGLDRQVVGPPQSAVGGDGTDTVAGGESQYDSQFGYDLNRINEVSGIYQNAPEWQLETDPGYQFRLDEGMRALDRSAASRGLTRSGGHEREVMAYGQGMASQEYQSIFNRLGTIAGFGPGASQAPVPYGQGTINQAGSNIVQAANTVGQAGYFQGAGRQGAFDAFGTWAGRLGQGWGFGNQPSG
jgi:hypothetical protein